MNTKNQFCAMTVVVYVVFAFAVCSLDASVAGKIAMITGVWLCAPVIE